jgi:hypothetical protein
MLSTPASASVLPAESVSPKMTSALRPQPMQ